MRQVLFTLPIIDLPIYGYGMMLFVAFVATTWLGTRLARREGIAPEHVYDLALWLFVGGLVGSRVVYLVQYPGQFASIWDFFAIWKGGLVFYGGMMGGVVAYLLAHKRIVRRHGLSAWKIADVVAPCAALGLCLGRVGCLLNGCCYGAPACPACPGISFPLSAPPRFAYTQQGYQTAAGFTVEAGPLGGIGVGAVAPGPATDQAGLRPDDLIVAADRRAMDRPADLDSYLGRPDGWPRGKNDLGLTVLRGGEEVPLPPFEPRTLRLHPTQLYESVSTGLLLLLLLAYSPLRRRDGEVMALFLMLYPLHRFLNEMLRADNDPVALGLTLSQNLSVVVFAVGLLLLLWLRRMPRQYSLAAVKEEPQPSH